MLELANITETPAPSIEAIYACVKLLNKTMLLEGVAEGDAEAFRNFLRFLTFNDRRDLVRQPIQGPPGMGVGLLRTCGLTTAGTNGTRG